MPRVKRKSISDIERQQQYLSDMAMARGNTNRAMRVNRIGNRYLDNIYNTKRSERLESAIHGYDNAYNKWYNAKYSKATYMRQAKGNTAT